MARGEPRLDEMAANTQTKDNKKEMKFGGEMGRWGKFEVNEKMTHR